MPRRQLEFRMLRLVPFRGTPVIVYDDGPRAHLAAATLERMGVHPYSDAIRYLRWEEELGKKYETHRA